MKRLADHHLSYLADRASESASLPSFLTVNAHAGVGSLQGRSASAADRAANGLPSPGQSHAQIEDGVPKGTSAMDGGDAIAMEERHDRKSLDFCLPLSMLIPVTSCLSDGSPEVCNSSRR